MERLPSSSVRRLVAWAVGPTLPAWAVLAGLTLGRFLSWPAAVFAGAIAFVLMAILVLARLADFDRLSRYAEESLTNPDAPPPILNTSATAQRLLAAITALRRLWAERRDAAAALAASRQNILDTLPEPLFLLDGSRRIISANAAARDVFEVGPDSARLLGRDLASVMRDPRVLGAADQALGQNKRAEASFTLPAPVGRTFSALFIPLTVASPDGTTLIATLSDHTERLKTDRMRADFVANASHELRTPLASVLGFIKTLQGPARDDEKARHEFLGIMLAQATRMTLLIDDLLSLSRIELREHTRPTDTIDMAMLMRATSELLEGAVKERHGAIRVAAPNDLPHAAGDGSELSQVFHNLLSNALKYGGGKDVDVVLETSDARPPAMPGKGPCLKISVRDYGEGIAREHLPRLTERFYRVDTARAHPWRNWAGAGDRQTHCAAPSRRLDHRQRTGEGCDVHGVFAADAGGYGSELAPRRRATMTTSGTTKRPIRAV